mmetsp:Transcript_2557/g.4810  ORF Transcript_2557/g.4810 Transcript_2557/m.4810 type:complete len:240 (-) Transcript_2557:55-774(-)
MHAADVNAEEVLFRPEMDLVVSLVVQPFVSEGGGEDRPVRREHLPPRLQEPVPPHNVRLQHPLVNQREAQRLRDDDVNLPLSPLQGHLLHLALDDGYALLQPIVLHELPRLHRNVAHLYPPHLLRPGLSGEEAQDTAPRPDVYDRRTSEVRGVVEHGAPVRASAHSIGEHVLLVTELGVVFAEDVAGLFLLVVACGGGREGRVRHGCGREGRGGGVLWVCVCASLCACIYLYLVCVSLV